ncbi:hypothetical protein HBH56_101230 [Parastagonospora nodorum]|uniref:Uncharacterized protein n=1 Tax=Phaeosphaeria nodorum (strain SN15 / ATCC MYA-4574 / FGSC 10173) TaxID=321614 RepID=A0A7U2FHN0_PHANO|nr:hypothetical protein HBH56_101230 [Parastagonospora nodorum]QRD04419.1 hypothetical protein JI435_421110 [Parastagonospora nodorum SN15]KAH3975501.1 hypothetical protein HBH52_123660 [Parastagonospora nodorum]KAH3978568.1 hypothetical protein HBH51_060600 [Parastagonospora nodorum]KAH3999360.1 hypothetical protein HBI10_117260 [Parastagonospora nodorum]
MPCLRHIKASSKSFTVKPCKPRIVTVQACPSDNDHPHRHHSEHRQPFMICWN